ncbi:MAG: site-specific DNA-methyltransferase [Shewanella sp.]|uniref:site-specific DNA-methyltransferase (adenine-specific) n=1 Tax=Vibrio alginolyticus TaxID=663 RepID=A0A0P0HJQ9_VIBAL|nr:MULTISPECIES: site-specific DNA-methyltransferase [Gammaproteobacteria]HDZ9328673.1 site-specific DNA-methyltransferase [Vibrio cholerae]ALJ83440.1 type III restriction-modification system methylation subunit [Vibrio alginolyticus]ANP65582.1 DNA methylase [Vibrio alginolyticus]MBO0152937.1 site-specific DNA-methyltransferase [Vibrio parahaemolyticus]MDG2735939.1 site-specific DNA-methyltransferase [Vibrio parahaemolyticus]
MPTLDFKGKQFVYSHHLSVPFRELKVVADKSLPQEGNTASLDDNLIIHGDNLEALKALLPTHAGKVDCIFIDPPYNTGNEGWCYNDNVRSPLMQEWLKKSANPVDKEDLERHDKWLCMMWPRLTLLKELLAETGSIWITLDDNESQRLKMLLDEIFGSENFVATICWQKKYAVSNDDDGIPDMHDYILVYRKSDKFKRNLLPRSEEQNSRYTNPDNDPRGRWSSDNYVSNKSKDERPTLYYPIKHPKDGRDVWPAENAVWRYSKSRHEEMVTEGRLYWGPDESYEKPRLKRYLSEIQDGKVPSTWWTFQEVGHNDEGQKELANIIGAKIFNTPKPKRLLKRIIQLAADENALILDSFAGSGTTAHAVLEANKSDEGNRKFILIECEDYADKVTAERVRRVINGYPFKGNQKQELLSEKITWSVFEKKHAELLEQIAKVEAKHSKDFDKIKKELKDGVLTVTGERKVDEFAPGIGGSFTYCTLGEPIQIESLLTGEAMPSFDALARYVFYTATGQSLETVAKASADGFIGETDLFRIHLFYRPDSEWLRSNEAALNAEKVEVIAKNNATKKRTIVFAVAKFMSQKDLTEKRIEFCQLPYAIHRIMGA